MKKDFKKINCQMLTWKSRAVMELQGEQGILTMQALVFYIQKDNINIARQKNRRKNA